MKLAKRLPARGPKSNLAPSAAAFPASCETCKIRGLTIYRKMPDGELTAHQESLIDRIVVPPKRLLVKEGQVPDEAYTIVFGWVARAKILPDGRRQILEFLMPGDVVAYDNLLDEPVRYSLQTLTQVAACVYPRRAFCDRMLRHNATVRTAAVTCAGRLADAEDHLVRLGRRSASERLANLVLHLHTRLIDRNLAFEKVFDLPLRLDDFADALGLTPVHVSRTLAALREQKLFAFRSGRAEILNRKAMEALAGA